MKSKQIDCDITYFALDVPHKARYVRCSLIKGFKNVISADMIDKLQFKTEEHPYPYGLTWLNKKKRDKSEQTMPLQFSIGKKVQVYYGVVLMDTCHLILGHPWQYNRITIHDGGKNTYNFV